MPTFGLLGQKLSHSFSPQIHAMLYSDPYCLFEKMPADLPKFLKSDSFTGLNVTIPYKKDVFPFCQKLSDTARKIGSVNTIVRLKDGSLYGDNTDYDGLTYMIQKSGIAVYGKKALILGSGGASLTAQCVLKDMGVSSLHVISRSGSDRYDTIYSRHADAQIILNATPVGMYPNNGISPIDLQRFKAAEGVFDLIYNPSKTRFLLDAERLGIPFANGLTMLVAQAKKSAELFLNHPIATEKIDEICHHLRHDTLNITLIGMPGCGKSTIGRSLAAMLNRPFIDTDEETTALLGESIPGFIKRCGEGAFRCAETKALSAISKKSGIVIATGGGIVTQPENYFLLRENSLVFYLNRPLADLPTDNRPLSGHYGVEELYRKRRKLYTMCADKTVPVCGIEQTAQIIKEMFFTL